LAIASGGQSRTRDDSPRPPEVHLWRVALDVDNDMVRRLVGSLDDDERRRAQRFHDPQLRRRQVVTRASVRAILSRYLDEAPSALCFTQGPNGKPSVVGDRIHFNVSHAGDVALVAIARDREVGVDAERISSTRDISRLTREFLSPREQRAMLALPCDQRVEAFFVCWTRKEALVKATGEGLSVPLCEVDVYPDTSLVPAEWIVRDLPAPSGYAVALAGRAPTFGVRLLTWRPGGAAPGKHLAT
jgi:4'-phosphopantetheinyl transferase